MASEDSRLRVSVEDGVTHIDFIDRNILDEANIKAIGEDLAQIIESSENPKLVISFANVDHLSSAALGQLISVNSKVREHSGQLRLSDISPQIYEVFAITKLNKLFEIHETSAKAAGSFS